jgi:IS5 family transposase
VVVDKREQKIICTAFCEGKKHDFRLFKESKTRVRSHVTVMVDTGYQGLQKQHMATLIPKKKSKKNPLSQEDKKRNREISSERVLNENVIGMIKRFKIIADKYRNRRKRFGLRFNLIAGIYNFELGI